MGFDQLAREEMTLAAFEALPAFSLADKFFPGRVTTFRRELVIQDGSSKTGKSYWVIAHQNPKTQVIEYRRPVIRVKAGSVA
jgi:hypothetical protein